ncbi:MAG: hypothetical protein KME64_21050 [Scytonematopsis contorta HA4267-MV1]|jgi:hypothetical protein|nr:hypothetical protein [Scytonematopsis contorta HA4267-MV1]
MLRLLLSASLITAVSFVPTFVLAQTSNVQFPQPSKSGDYNSIQSRFRNGTTSTHLVWKVVSNNLACRSQPGTNYRVVRKLSKNDVIDLVGSRSIKRDATGKPWLLVAKQGSAEDIKIKCFVRANVQFIKPIPYSF